MPRTCNFFRPVLEHLETRLVPSTGTASPPLLAVDSLGQSQPHFSWTADSDATRYDLWVTDLSTGQDQFIRQPNLTTNSFTAANPLPVGTYVAWVQAFAGTISLGGWSAGLRFSIAAPAAPTLTGPATGTSTTPELDWDGSAGATQYDVWVNNLSTGQTQVIRQTVATTSFTTDPLAPGQYVFWVRAANSAGAFGAWSTGYNFLIDTTAPAIPTITGPSSSTPSLTPNITWSASAGAATYDLWVSNLTSGQTVIRQQTLATNSFAPATSLTVGSYVAWVRAFDDTNQSRGWSAAFKFTITPPAAPTQLGPTGSITSATPTFSWGVAVGGVRYDLWVDDLTTGQHQVIRQQNLTTNSFTSLNALAKGSYRFWVRALNGNGNASSWSGAVDFTIM
jgi:predicted phage tail protein